MTHRAISLFGASLILASALGKVSAATTVQTNQPTGAPATADVIRDDGMDAGAIEERIQGLEKSSEGDAAARARLVEIYRQVLQQTKSAIANEGKAEAFRKSMETAPIEIASVRSRIAALESSPATNALADLQADATIQEAENRLGQEQAALQSLKSRLADTTRRIGEEEARPAAARTAAVEAKAMLDKIKAAMEAPAPAPDSEEPVRASRLLLERRLKARAAEIHAIDQELLSNPVRLELLNATRDLTARQIDRAEAGIKALESRLSELRAAEVARARVEALEIQEEAVGKHRLLQAEADEITKINEETQGLGPKTDTARRIRESTHEQLEQIRSDLEEAKRSLELDGITDEFATVLLEQRQSLQSKHSLEKTAAEIGSAKSLARLRLFKIDRQIRQLGDVERAAEQLLSQADDLPKDEAAKEELAVEMREILTAKREHLQKLAQAHRAYAKELHQRESEQAEFASQITLMAELLDENLLWIRNAPPMSWKSPGEAAAQSVRLAGDPRWSALLRDLRYDIQTNPSLYLMCLAAVAALIAYRRRMIANLERQTSAIGKVGSDRIGITVNALLITVGISAPGALVPALLGWRMTQLDGELAEAAGNAALVSALAYFIVRFIKAVCRPVGLGSEHFGWNGDNLRIIRKHVTWFLPFAAICSVPMAFFESLGDPLYSNALGRPAFIVLMAAASGLTFMVFHRRRGLKLAGKGENPGWAARTRILWQPAAILLPLVLAALAAAGYSYMGVALEYRLNQTVVLLLAVIGAYAFGCRWLAIYQRRLSLKIAMEKREALRRCREEDEDYDQDIDPLELLPDIDMSEVREQSSELLRMAAGLAVILGLWFSWSDVFPAFRVLDKVELWDHTVVVEGQETIKAITLSNLGLSISIFIVTILAARNFPGFLEIAVLQRLPVDQGSRYATRTLTLYAIVSIGVALGFNAMGIGWSSVQWLVAALTVGLGFGLQEIFGNFVSGLIILLERPIRVGDTVTVGSISGVVSEIRMRATTITDWTRKELVVPNKSFITGELINWSLSDPILRMEFCVGVAYGSDTTLAHKTMLEVCKDHPMVMEQPEPTVFFVGFGDNSLNFDVRFFVMETNNTARTRIVHDLHMAIDAAFRKLDICIAFPQRDVHLDTLTPLDVRVVPLQDSKGVPDAKKTKKPEQEE